MFASSAKTAFESIFFGLLHTFSEKEVCKTEKLSFLLDSLSKIIWGPALLVLVLGAGAFLTAATGFFPIRKAGAVIRNTLGRIFKSKSAFAATATALGATVGTGNIIGVASAIALGGPGAVFWMWVGAFFGMMLKFAEAALAVKYRGGAMKYIEKAFGGKFFAAVWCICCVLASFGGGNMVQSNAAGAVFYKFFGISPLAIGMILAVLTALVLFGGAKTVIRTSSYLVPFMAAIYVAGCFGVLFICREGLLSALESIFASAFEPISIGGGISGILVSEALRVGIAKGTFTHEAGMGSASLAHAESGEKNPLLQGCWGIVEVFIDTIFVCTLTALVILSSGGKFTENSAADAFSAIFGMGGRIFLCVSMFLFALAAIIGWAFYGEKALENITKSKISTNLYRFFFCSAIIFGSAAKLPLIWSITDIFNGLMVFPNLAAIILLSPEVIKITKGK
ncbi:MAG: sodium:alanine symporter family protein [Oscillospiraceae bacterium]|nr:sodium:alanine symporter family protein [Oscillospiraceae bacterium]